MILKTGVMIILFYIVITSIIWWNTPEYIPIPEPKIASEGVKKAMLKMGPKYNYRMIGDKLQVDKGNGVWLNLRYDKENK